MRVYEISRDDEALREAKRRISSRDWQALMTHSTSLYLLESTQPLAVFGLMPLALLSNVAYLWFLPYQDEVSQRDLRQGRRLAWQFFESCPWELHAECDKGSLRDQRFARWCGFRPIGESSDRILYKWS